METWEPSQHSLVDTGKPRKTCVEVLSVKLLIAAPNQQWILLSLTESAGCLFSGSDKCCCYRTFDFLNTNMALACVISWSAELRSRLAGRQACYIMLMVDKWIPVLNVSGMTGRNGSTQRKTGPRHTSHIEWPGIVGEKMARKPLWDWNVSSSTYFMFTKLDMVPSQTLERCESFVTQILL